jgi:small-conductance mechanosensitive channel
MLDVVGLAESLWSLSSRYEEWERFVDDLTSVEGRLAVSVVVVVVALLVTVVVAPKVLGRVNAAIVARLPTGRTQAAVGIISDYLPTTVGRVFLRAVQLAVLVLAGVALLVVWGLVGTALTILQVLGLSLPLLARIGTTVTLLLFAYIAADVLDGAVEQFSEGADRITEHQEEIVLRLGHVTILVFVFGGVLTLWGVNLSGLLVGAGFLGIVVGLAARQTLGSIFAGFVLMFSRPFTIGDWVKVGSHEGIVTDITIMATHMRNFDGESIVIPNDTVSNEPIVNRSRQGHLRIRLEVGVDYETDTEHAEDIALEAIETVDVISMTPSPAVVPKSFGDSAVVLEMRFWIERPTPPRRWRAIEDVIHVVKKRFEANGIKIPFPQRELSGRAETEGFRVQESKSVDAGDRHTIDGGTPDTDRSP